MIKPSGRYVDNHPKRTGSTPSPTQGSTPSPWTFPKHILGRLRPQNQGWTPSSLAFFITIPPASPCFHHGRPGMPASSCLGCTASAPRVADSSHLSCQPLMFANASVKTRSELRDETELGRDSDSATAATEQAGGLHRIGASPILTPWVTSCPLNSV